MLDTDTPIYRTVFVTHGTKNSTSSPVVRQAQLDATARKVSQKNNSNDNTAHLLSTQKLELAGGRPATSKAAASTTIINSNNSNKNTTTTNNNSGNNNNTPRPIGSPVPKGRLDNVTPNQFRSQTTPRGLSVVSGQIPGQITTKPSETVTPVIEVPEVNRGQSTRVPHSIGAGQLLVIEGTGVAGLATQNPYHYSSSGATPESSHQVGAEGPTILIFAPGESSGTSEIVLPTIERGYNHNPLKNREPVPYLSRITMPKSPTAVNTEQPHLESIEAPKELLTEIKRDNREGISKIFLNFELLF